ncbi:hypothetical protein ACWKSP_28380 [Micromonosporaceae bacterium Da 78-11]
MNRFLRTAVVATTALSIALVAGAPADAAVKPLDAAKKAVTERIDKRLTALKGFTTTLGEAKQVQQAHRGTLTKLITDQTAALTALRTKVGTETTGAAVKADAKSMINDYRVFILTGPKVRLTAAIDTELAVVDKLHDRKDVDDAKLDAIAKSLDGKVDTLLAIKPGPDGPALRAQVKTVRQGAKDARTSLKALRKSK